MGIFSAKSEENADVDIVGELKINADGTKSYQTYGSPQTMPSGGVSALEPDNPYVADGTEVTQGTGMSDVLSQMTSDPQQGSSQQQTGDVDAYGNPVDNSSSNASSDSEDENTSQDDNSQSNSNSTGDPLIDLFISLICMEMEFRQQRFEYAMEMRAAHHELMHNNYHDYGLEQPDLALSAREDDKKEPLNPALFAAMRERD